MGRRRKKPFDRYALYEHSVQEPVKTMVTVAKTFRRVRGREPRTLREDFCGTAANCEAWVERHRDNRAVGVDLDPEPLAWARARRFTPGSIAAERVRLVEGDVLAQRGGRYDVIAALNFSWMVFRTREEALRYFRRVRASLARDGVFTLDLYGGPDAYRPMREATRMGGYTYCWDQLEYEAISGETRCAIHFRLGDGTRKANVFTYHWRVWGLAETIDLLHDSGFELLDVQHEIPSDDGRTTGAWKSVTRMENWRSFVANVYAGPR